jgi:hypothetical protein
VKRFDEQLVQVERARRIAGRERDAGDSPLEGAGFEPSVPGSRERGPPIVSEQVANRFPGS